MRWRNCPMATPGVEGWIQGSIPTVRPKYWDKPMALASNAASSKPAATSAALDDRAGDPLPAKPHAATATTQPHSQVNINGQKLVLGGWV